MAAGPPGDYHPMKFWTEPSSSDALLLEKLEGFLPSRIFDIHAHLFNAEHCQPQKFPGAFDASSQWDAASFAQVMSRRLRNRTVNGLFFGYPSKLVNHRAANTWISQDMSQTPRNKNRALALVSPGDNPETVRATVAREKFVGLKPYHVYAHRTDTMQAAVEEFAPDWMWEFCHDIHGVLMLHIVRDRAIADPKNIASLQRLCRRYPKCQLILAHIARSFNYRHALEGLAAMKDFSNAFVDTALVTEAEGIRFAIETLGPERVLYGSDFPFSELRGKCASVGDGFAWIYADELPDKGISTIGNFTLLGIESLLCVKDACASCGLKKDEVNSIFLHNAQRLLGLG